jgi:hypothetical protein
MNYLLLVLCVTASLRGSILEDYYRERENRRAQTIATIKWQNTLLTRPEYPVGIYKNDLVNAGFLVSFIAADMLLYNELKKWLIDTTMRELIDDLDGLIATLERTQASERRFEERMALAVNDTSLSIEAKKSILANPLRRYLSRHSLDHLRSKKILSALGFRLLWDRLSCWLEREMVIPPPSLVTQLLGLETDNELRLAHERAYLCDKLAVSTPYSATTAVKTMVFLVSPFMALRANFRTGNTSFGLSNLGLFNRFLGTGLPEWLFSQGAQSVLELIELAGAVSFFVQSNRYHWITYAVEHRSEFLGLLYTYRQILEDPAVEEAQVKRSEQEIRIFIKKGYTRTSILPGVSVRHWWSSQEQSELNLSDWLGYATLAILALKSADLLGTMVSKARQ